jgi:3-hydroxyacyl-CoA dehydrogenase/enoyl-CoA hydratase/3-hydroxybutyryl-CoA epimerase
MQKNNRNGLSSNKGFYDYKEGNRKHIWRGLTELITLANHQLNIEEIENRLLYSSINNIFYNYIKHSQLKNSQEYDYMAINNIGLPKWTGGPFTWVKKNNINNYIKNNEIYSRTLGSRFIINKKIIEVIQNKVF